MKNLKDEIQSVVNIFKSGNLSEAEGLCRQLINKNPKIAFLYNLLGLILASKKKFDDAIKYYEKGISIDPKFAMIYNNLGLIYFNNKSSANIKKAESYYKKSISLDDNIAVPHNNLGTLYNSRSKYKEAEISYKKAISIDPKFFFAHFNLGTLFITIGNFTEAKKCLLEAIKLNPNLIEAHRALSRITKYNKKDKHLNELIRLYKQGVSNKSDLCFSLGKAHEDIKDFKNSFNFYNEANSLCRKNINFSLLNEKKLFDDIKKIFNEKLFNKFINSGLHKQKPIFIVGMPRSGTTLVEQILSSHPKVFGGDEVETVPYLIKKYFNNKDNVGTFNNVFNLEESIFKTIGEEYILKMNDFSNYAERTTDKLPVNFLSIGLIKLILPHSKIVHCHRNPKDNIFSIFKNNFTSDKVTFAYELSETVGYYNLYKDLIKHWNLKLPGFVYNVKYENLVKNTKIEIKKLLKFCDLDWSDKCLKFYNNKRPIKTASDTQARSKIYKSSINSWKNYEEYLNKYFFKLRD